MVECSSKLLPVVRIPPLLPPKLHNEFEGVAVASFIVDLNGRVQSPTIASSEWHPIGRTRTNSLGYNEEVLAAVRQWRYPPQPHPCIHRATFEFKFDESVNLSSGRSN
jgi:outer membrane biosynthesis protein TonB